MILVTVFLLCSGYGFAQPLKTVYTDLVNATSVSVTPNSIYVVEQSQDRLIKLDRTGKLMDTIGGRGSGDYQFSKPVDVDATNGLKIFVTDQNNRRIQVFDRRGQFLSSISERTSFANSREYVPDQLSVNSLGEIYFWDTESRLIRRFDMDYNFDDEFRISSDVRSVDEIIVTTAEILILDRSTETIHRLSPNGGYSGFYPANGVQAFYTNERGIWKAYAGRVELEYRDGEIQKFPYGENIEPVDMHVMGGAIYILTDDSLYLIESNLK